MHTKQQVLDFLEKNNCNQKLINHIKDNHGYDNGYDYIALSYTRHGVKFTKLASQHEKARNGYDVYYIAFSYKKHGVEFTELALQHEKAENGYHASCIAKEMFKESKNS